MLKSDNFGYLGGSAGGGGGGAVGWGVWKDIWLKTQNL